MIANGDSVLGLISPILLHHPTPQIGAIQCGQGRVTQKRSAAVRSKDWRMRVCLIADIRARRRQFVIVIVGINVTRKDELPDITKTFGSSRPLLHPRKRRNEKGREDRNHSDHHEQLNQREREFSLHGKVVAAVRHDAPKTLETQAGDRFQRCS
jgi:hypothetical protein